jgi:NAD(P)H dehydrogenase (quinone)
MNTLIIYCHPNRESLNYAMLKVIEKKLKEKNTPYRVIDLYQENFNPALVYNKEKRRRDMYLDPEMKAYQEAILWAKRLVFIYPIFWSRPPAMVLGFIDRVFASNFGYKDTGKLLPEGLLKGKEAVVVSTLKGPAFFLKVFMRNAHQVLMKRALFSYVGIKKSKFFEFGSVEGQGPREDKARKRAFKKLDMFFDK